MIPEAEVVEGGAPRPPEAWGPGSGAPRTAAAPEHQVSVSSPFDDPATSEGQDRRRRIAGRYAGRDMQRRLLDQMGRRDLRLRRCGWRLGESRAFRVGAGGTVRSVGVERCGNARLCSVCGPAAAAVRAAELGAGVWRWMTANDTNSAVFMSMAASHKSTDRLEDLHGQLIEARGRVMQSNHRRWQEFRRRFGIVDMAWRVEHNVGRSGPHVGLHAVFLTTRWWDADDAQAAQAWLVLRFREELARAGFTGRLSCDRGVDLRPVDDPAGLGRYLTKWGIGQELAAEANKLGRNGENVPYTAIPAVLALELGRRDPQRVARLDRRVAMLVDGWRDYVDVATKDDRHWYRGFRKLKELVPELRDAHRPVEVIAVATDVLPEELRPQRAEEAEAEEDDDPDAVGTLLEVEGEAWSAAQLNWWRGLCISFAWHLRYSRWIGTQHGPLPPLELVVCWLAEDDGLEAAAEFVAELAGGVIVGEETGLVVRFPDDRPGCNVIDIIGADSHNGDADMV